MDKLKKVFSPGSSKDDEVMYGDEASRKASATAASSEQDTAKLYPTQGAEKEPGVLRQILNPGGHKHDESAYGTTATTEKPDPSQSQHGSDQKDHTIAQQILNPGGEKYDPQRFGTAGGNTSNTPVAGPNDVLETDPAEKKHEHSVLRQIINPGGKNYDNEGYGNTAHVVGDSSAANTSQSQPTTGPTSSLNREPVSASTSAGFGNPTGQDSHVGRDAAVAGTGLAGYEAAKHHPQSTESTRTSELAPSSRTQNTSSNIVSSDSSHPSQQVTRETYGSSAPLADPVRDPNNSSHLGRDAAIGAGVAAAGGAAAYGVHHNTRDRDESGRSLKSTQTTGTTGNESHLGRDAAILGTTGLAGGVAAHGLNESRNEPARSEQTGLSQHTSTTAPHTGVIGDNSSPEGSILNRPHPLPGGTTAESTTSTMFGGPGFDKERGVHQPGQGIEAPAPGSGVSNGLSQNTSSAIPANSGLIHTHGPHITDTANQLDPHIPGEFPSDDGTDQHSHSISSLTAGAAAGAAANTTSTAPTSTSASTSTPGYGSSQPSTTLGSSQISRPGDEQTGHTGRNVAAAAAAAAGAGTVASSLSSNSANKPTDATTASSMRTADAYPSSGQTASGTGVASGSHGLSSSQPPSTQSAVLGQTPATHTSTVPETTSASVGQGKTADKPHHHTSEGAAGVGAGAAGIAAYEASKSHGDTGPASKTTGPHQSNLANVVDPRVQPDPSKMDDARIAAQVAAKSHDDTGPASKTIGPHESNLANVVDPRVQPNASTLKNQTTASHSQSEPLKPEHDQSYGIAGEDKHDKHHNKLQKARPEETEHGEKKPSLIHRILHPGEHKKETGQAAASQQSTESTHQSSTTPHTADLGDRTVEPHTGLPMNVEKYGTGAGGTDGSSNIPGHHQTDPAVPGPDWEAIRKANTPY